MNAFAEMSSTSGSSSSSCDSSEDEWVVERRARRTHVVTVDGEGALHPNPPRLLSRSPVRGRRVGNRREVSHDPRMTLGRAACVSYHHAVQMPLDLFRRVG